LAVIVGPSVEEVVEMWFGYHDQLLRASVCRVAERRSSSDAPAFGFQISAGFGDPRSSHVPFELRE
jgi:hypothetical protein